MTRPTLDADRARTELYEVMQLDLPFEEKAVKALRLGEGYLEVENAHLTRIDEVTDFWEAIVSTDPPDGDFPRGMVLDLQTTYCRRAIDQGTSITLHDAPNQGWADDPAFETHGLHCYHGTPLTVQDEPIGTVCFVSERPRDGSFDSDETMFAELIARMLEREWEHTRERELLNKQAGLIGVLSRVLRHNLRNDLNVVRGSVSMLGERAPDSEDIQRTALRTIDDLVELSETARELESVVETELDRRPVELTTLVRDVIGPLQENYPAATFRVESPDGVMMEAMPSLKTALDELIENAAKHAGDEPDVTVSIEGAKNPISVDVIDNGPGLPEQERQVLGSGSETQLIHGSGLGLWLAYWVVTSHDGTIDAETRDDGTTVTITLPRGSVPADVTEYEGLTRAFERDDTRF